MPEMYVMKRDGVPVGYAYGDPWVSQALLMNDWQFDTPEETIKAWDRYVKSQEKKNKE